MIGGMEEPAFWHKEFTAFFEWCEERLREVLDAPGAREIWLQGEAFRYFRYHRKNGSLIFWTNDYKRNDFVCYHSEESNNPSMIAEIKLYGLNYLAKNLTGHYDMSPYIRPSNEMRFVFTSDDAKKCHPKESSILRDYRKLLEQKNDGNLLAMMLLILDMRAAGNSNSFGEAIQVVDFGRDGVDLFEDEDILIRCWTVG